MTKTNLATHISNSLTNKEVMSNDSPTPQQVAFGNDISRIVRGIAIIMMIINHSLPGKIIGVAVPLFSFLVGYGYAFAREHTVALSVKRVWHLLRNYWIVLFLICLPAALIKYPAPIHIKDVALSMWGCDPKLNFFSWYIYFYIFVMASLPLLSRIIDRYGLRGTLGLCALCGGIFWAISLIPDYSKTPVASQFARCFRYLPIVLMAYWMARNKVFSRLRQPAAWWGAFLAVGVLVGVYFLRGLPYAQIFDFALAPVMAGCIAVMFAFSFMNPLRTVLTELGMHSMHMWFLHAVFFTHATRGVFGPLVDWIKIKPLWIVAVVVLSYIMAVVVAKLVTAIERAFSRTTSGLIRFNRD